MGTFRPYAPNAHFAAAIILPSSSHLMAGSQGELGAQKVLKEVERQREYFGGVLQLRPQLLRREMGDDSWRWCGLPVIPCLLLLRAARRCPNLPGQHRERPCHTFHESNQTLVKDYI